MMSEKGNRCSRRVCFSTNTNCNLHCIYCYENKEDLDSFDVEFAKNKLDEILRRKTPYGTRVKLHGGEPFLAFEKIKDLCEFLWDQKYPEDFSIHLTTNGTLIHGEVQTWLYRNKHRIVVKLSLDGCKEAHDVNRPNSFDRIDIPFFLKTWPNLEVKMTISPLSLRWLSKSVKYLHAIGVQNISCDFAEMVNWNDRQDGVTLSHEMDLLTEYYLLHPQLNPCSLYNVHFRFVKNPPNTIHPCTIGTKQAFDYHTRMEYPCHLYFESTCGVDASRELLKIDLGQKENQLSEYCENCKLVNLCHTCYAANFIARGKTSLRDMSHCFLNKVKILCVAKYLYQLYVINGHPLDKAPKDLMIYRDIAGITELISVLNNIESQIIDYEKSVLS